MNDLIVAPETDVLEGAGAISGAKDFAESLTASEPDAVQIGFNAASYGLDALAVGTDPLGKLIEAGVGWLIEYVSFLREPLDWLAGDPGQITAQARTWHNASQAMTSMAQDYPRDAAAVTGWDGAAAAEYRGAVQDYAHHLRRAAGAADDVAGEILNSGAAVATVRSLIRDLIVGFISAAIKRALVAVAAAFGTFGGSAIAFGLHLGAEAALLAADITGRIQKLLDVLAASGGRLQEAASVLDRVRGGVIEFGKQTTKAEQEQRSW